jgi:hypothetical protein
MGKIVQLLIKYLGEARGNATYDVLRRWVWPMIPIIGSGLVAWFKNAPIWEVVGIVCLVSYLVAFLINRKRKPTPTKPQNQLPTSPFQPDDRVSKLFTKMVDMVKADKEAAIQRLGHGPPLAPIGALIHFSDEMRSEDELLWYCSEFDKHGYKQPLKYYQEVLPDKWLPVLTEARHNQMTIKNDMSFLSFLVTSWSDSEKWKQAQRLKNVGNNAAILTEFIPTDSGIILHACSKCGYSIKIRDPKTIAYGANGVQTVTCPSCNHIDKLTSNESTEEILERIYRRARPEIYEKVVTVESALWQASDRKPFDVTKIVQAYISDGKLEIHCTNELFGDPHPGLGKVLTIEWFYDGKKHKNLFPEGRIARLPNPL